MREHEASLFCDYSFLKLKNQITKTNNHKIYIRISNQNIIFILLLNVIITKITILIISQYVLEPYSFLSSSHIFLKK